MDYQVFLLSRIKERYTQTGDTAGSVAFGVGSTARLITGAALIIIAVFSGFAAGDLVMFQQMGFGVAVALLVDATIVRCVLVPASMKLLGERNWYFPSWLNVDPGRPRRRTRFREAKSQGQATEDGDPNANGLTSRTRSPRSVAPCWLVLWTSSR